MKTTQRFNSKSGSGVIPVKGVPVNKNIKCMLLDHTAFNQDMLRSYGVTIVYVLADYAKAWLLAATEKLYKNKLYSVNLWYSGSSSRFHFSPPSQSSGPVALEVERQVHPDGVAGRVVEGVLPERVHQRVVGNEGRLAAQVRVDGAHVAGGQGLGRAHARAQARAPVRPRGQMAEARVGAGGGCQV